MSDQNMRQSKGQHPSSVRVNGRITRGFSDLPKEEPKVESESSEEEEEEQSESTPKTKKIHHMTLKAMERRKKMAEEAEKLGIAVEQPKPEEKPAPRKRGRPKGSKKVVRQEDKEEYIGNQIEQEVVSDKKELNLRHKSKVQMMAQPESQEKPAPVEELKAAEEQIQVPQKAVPEPKPALVGEVVPKKRGRKKKIHPEPQNLVMQPVAPVAKVYTVPKAQTFDNYLKYYDKLMEQARKGEKQDVPLIFDRFNDPEAYTQFISELKK